MDNGASSYRRFLDGDNDGIVEIIKEYKDGLILYLNSFVKNIHIAEDLTEDTFVRIVVKKPRYSGKSSFKTWLYAIGRNTAVDYVRKHSKMPVIHSEDVLLIQKDETDIEREYLKDEQKIFVHKILKRLNTEYQKILYLIYFENFTLSQSAEIMKKSYKQIENLIYRAKLSLKSELEKEGYVYEEL